MTEHASCELNIPYPPVETGGKNIHFANLLLNDYAGAGGEMTALTQYSYQDIICMKDYPKIADALECISMVEMHHFHILGELIRDFGGDPQVRTVNRGEQRFWTAKYANYAKNPARFLRDNIVGEKAAIAAYRKRLSQIDDLAVQKMIERIILDEEHHISIFEKLLETEF